MSEPPERATATTSVGVEELPTYAALQQQEGARFGRWAGWVEKRALERRAERQANPQTSSWDLPGVPGADRLVSTKSTRSRQSAVEADWAPQLARPRLANVETTLQEQDAQRNVAKPGLVLGSQVTRLTPSVSIHNIGQRFLAQLPEEDQPLCAAAIKSQVGSTSRLHRYLLMGTSNGLWVCDLMPNFERSVKAATLEDAVIVQLWRGAVHQLEVYEGDPVTGRSGTVVAVTPQLEENNSALSLASASVSGPHTSGDQVRLWPLQALLNLIKYRTLQPQTTPVALNLASSPMSEGLSRESKRSSFLAFRRSLSPNDHDPKGKGKAKAFRKSWQGPHDEASDMTRISSSKSLTNLDGSSSKTTEPLSRQSSDVSHIDMAERWARASVPLALPKNHLPVQFIRLLVPHQLQSIRHAAEESIYLAVSCKSSVYLFESKVGVRRSWTMVHELYTPQQATAIDMVHYTASDAPASPYLGVRSTHSPHKPVATTSATLSQHPTLSLFVRMKEKAVLIRLADASVREVRVSDANMDTPSAQSSRRRRSSFGRSSISGRRTSFSGESIRDAIQTTLKLGRTDDWWTSCTRVDIGLPMPFLFITKADRTFMIPEPMTSTSVGDRGALELQPVFSWSWRLTPTSLHVSTQTLPSTKSASRVKLALQAVTASGVEVHEGEGNFSLIPSGGRLIWSPATQSDMDAHTSYDLGLTTEPLGSVRLPLYADEPDVDRQGMVMAVHAVGEWKLKFVG